MWSVLVTEVPGEPLGAYLEDELRGELVFRLWGNGTMGSPVTYLPVRHITRVHVDEASRASLGTGGQVLAMVDIPPGVVAANLGETDFLIEVRRYRRIAGDPVAFEETTPTSDGFDWFGWSHPGNFGIFKIPITINASADAIGSFNEFRGWDKHAGRYKEFAIAADLATMVPRPTMGMSVFKSGGAAAAAWQIELTYPEEKVRLVGVSAWRNQRSAATTFLTPLTPEPVPDAAGCVPSGEGRVRVSAFEPSIGIGRVDLIVEPRPLTCAGRLATNELALRPSTLRVYDFDGADISSTGYGASQGSKFR